MDLRARIMGTHPEDTMTLGRTRRVIVFLCQAALERTGPQPRTNVARCGRVWIAYVSPRFTSDLETSTSA